MSSLHFHLGLERSWWQHICQCSGCDLSNFTSLNAKGINQFFIASHKRQMSPLSLGFVYFCFWHFCLWGFLHFWDVLGIPAESTCAEVSKYKKLIKSFSLPRIEHIPKCMEDWMWKKHSHKHRAQKVIFLRISTSQNAPLLDLLYSSKFSYQVHPTPLRKTS